MTELFQGAEALPEVELARFALTDSYLALTLSGLGADHDDVVVGLQWADAQAAGGLLRRAGHEEQARQINAVRGQDADRRHSFGSALHQAFCGAQIHVHVAAATEVECGLQLVTVVHLQI